MNKTLTFTALVVSLALSAQTRWDYEIGLRTPPPQGGMFGNFWNYQLLVKASPRKATAELGSGRWAWRLRTGQNTLSYSQSPNNNSFWVNTTSMLGFERLSRRGSFLKTYYGAEIGGSLNAYQGTNNGSLSYGPTATVLYGLRYRVKPRWTLAAEVAPSFGFWFSKYNDEWQVPMTQFNLSGQSIGISATYRI